MKLPNFNISTTKDVAMNIYEEDKSEVGESNTHTFMDIDEFNAYKASCEYVIQKAKDAAKLAKNPEFISIIMEDYFENEPKRLGSLMASGRLTPQGFEGAVHDLKSIGHLRAYLQDFISKGNIASEELIQLEEARNEAIREQEEAGA